jgi:hypothetical protein
MHSPSTQDLLAAWEHGRAVPEQTSRALALLAAAHTDVPPGEIARLSIGTRDRLLLSLRRMMFGSRLKAVTLCPACQASLELEFDADDISVAPLDRTELPEGAEQLSLSHDGYHISFRLPNSLDLLALPKDGPVDENMRVLVERLLIRAFHDDREMPAVELPPAVVNALGRRISLADPQAEVRLNLSCAECGANWRAPFDIVSYLWCEIDTWAMRVLRDVHRLARAYGWPEDDILALSPTRRQRYLEMLDE